MLANDNSRTEQNGGHSYKAMIAERLSARHLILLRCRIAFVCMYVRHTLIVAWAMYVLRVRSPQHGPRRVIDGASLLDCL